MVCKVPRTHSPPREPHSAARPEPPGTPTKQSPSAKAACARGQPPADPIALQKALVHLVKHGTVKEVEQALASVSVRPAAPSAAPDRAEGGGSRLSTPYKVLHAAIDEQREDMVELLIAKGFDVLEEDESCYTALLCAAEAGNERLVYLIAEGWRLQNPGAEMSPFKSREFVEKLNEQGDSALTLACKGGHVEAVRALLDIGANVSGRNGSGLRPIQVACRGSCSLEMLEVLLHRWRGNLTPKERCEDIVAALRNGFPALLSDVAAAAAVRANISSGNGGQTELSIESTIRASALEQLAPTALHLVASKGLIGHVSLLLANDSDVNALWFKQRHGRDPRIVLTPLMLALLGGHYCTCALLMAFGAHVPSGRVLDELTGGDPASLSSECLDLITTRELRWSMDRHRYWPDTFKTSMQAFLCAYYRSRNDEDADGDSCLGKLPLCLVHKIVESASLELPFWLPPLMKMK
mmetsp:Transcript_12582/g.45918  ORF Transcript_12582/g.45918 Transcript_12582/m.45918 type:complete len:467 (+) Transcript_12582:212-1612(+)